MYFYVEVASREEKIKLQEAAFKHNYFWGCIGQEIIERMDLPYVGFGFPVENNEPKYLTHDTNPDFYIENQYPKFTFEEAMKCLS